MMPKATVSGGASSAWEPSPALWECAGCATRYAAGSPRCPDCPETAHREVTAESAFSQALAAVDIDALAAQPVTARKTVVPAGEPRSPAPGPEPKPAAPPRVVPRPAAD